MVALFFHLACLICIPLLSLSQILSSLWIISWSFQPSGIFLIWIAVHVVSFRMGTLIFTLHIPTEWWGISTACAKGEKRSNTYIFGLLSFIHIPQMGQWEDAWPNWQIWKKKLSMLSPGHLGLLLSIYLSPKGCMLPCQMRSELTGNLQGSTGDLNCKLNLRNQIGATHLSP